MDDKPKSKSAIAQSSDSNPQSEQLAALQERIGLLEVMITELQTRLKSSPLLPESLSTESTLQPDSSVVLPDSKDKTLQPQLSPGILCDVEWINIEQQNLGNYVRCPGCPPSQGLLARSSGEPVPPLRVETYFNRDREREKTVIKVESKGLQELIKQPWATC